MIIVRLKGGLGNQMFQYALGRVLAIKNNTTLKLDTSFLELKLANITKRTYDLGCYNIKAEIAGVGEIPIFYRLFKNKIASYTLYLLHRFIKTNGKEKKFGFDSEVLSLGPNTYLDGYWQSPKYFMGFEDVIKKDFTLKISPPTNVQALGDEMSSTNSLCVHVRRGDYVGNTYHEVVDTEYYQKGIELLSQKSAIEKIYVFSDDINWCKDNLSFPIPMVFVSDDLAGTKGEGHMYLMSKCKNFIIANSSFSWWGAWLADFKDKIVVCPRFWFSDTKIDTNDLIPENWIRI